LDITDTGRLHRKPGRGVSPEPGRSCHAAGPAPDGHGPVGSGPPSGSRRAYRTGPGRGRAARAVLRQATGRSQAVPGRNTQFWGWIPERSVCTVIRALPAT